MEYKKDFDNWNKLKKKLDNKNQRLSFCEKEIWWCSIGVNVGSEQDGKQEDFLRPVLVYKKINNRTFIGLPLTKVLKEDNQHIAFYFECDLHTLIISQIRNYDSKRFYDRMGSISDYLYSKTKKVVTLFLS